MNGHPGMCAVLALALLQSGCIYDLNGIPGPERRSEQARLPNDGNGSGKAAGESFYLVLMSMGI